MRGFPTPGGLYVLDLWGDRPLRWKIGLPYLTSPAAQVL